MCIARALMLIVCAVLKRLLVVFWYFFQQCHSLHLIRVRNFNLGATLQVFTKKRRSCLKMSGKVSENWQNFVKGTQYIVSHFFTFPGLFPFSADSIFARDKKN